MDHNLSVLLQLCLVLIISWNQVFCGRKLSFELNPKCDNSGHKDKCDSNDTNLVYIQSKGSDDVIHYLWSSITSIPPSLLIVKTDTKGELNEVNWDQILSSKSTDMSNAINFTTTPLDAIGLQFSRIFFFNDVNKTGSFDPRYDVIDYNWDQFHWQRVQPPEQGSDNYEIHLNGSQNDFQNLSLSFDLRVDSSDGRSDELPHLAFTQMSSYLELHVIDVEIAFNDTDINRPRLMTEVLLIKDGMVSKKTELDKITSIDDEYTPGVFTRIQLEMESKEDENSDQKEKKGFISWKPIAYNADERLIANTLDVIESDVKDINEKEITEYNSRLLKAFFDHRINSSHSFDLTFGATDDEDYYTKKKHNTFALVVGLGSAPDENVSFLVQMIIYVGFGLPVLVMVVSGVYLIVHKVRNRKRNDLLLSHQRLNN